MLLIVGLRGRRVGDHHHCRKCGRDLFGLDAPTVCPECGVDPSDDPPMIGRRVRRTSLIAAGLTLALPCLLWLGGVAWVAANGTDLMPYKPTWLVVRGAGKYDGRFYGDELRRRLDGGRIDADHAAELVDEFIAHQGDWSLERRPHECTFVEHAAAAGFVTPAQWQRYVAQAVGHALRSRPRVRAGGQVPLVWEKWQFALGTGGSPLAGWAAGSPAVSFELQLRDDDGNVLARLPTQVHGHRDGGIAYGQLPVPLTATGRLSVVLDVMPAWPPVAAPKVAAPPAAPTTLAQVEVVPADQPTAVAVESEQMRGIFADVVLDHYGDHHWYDNEVNRVRVLINPTRELWLALRTGGKGPLPVALAAEAWVEWGNGRRHRLANVQCPVGPRTQTLFTSSPLPADFDAETVTIRLTPSPDVAESTPDITEYWGKEWVWENVKVDWPGVPVGSSRP